MTQYNQFNQLVGDALPDWQPRPWMTYDGQQVRCVEIQDEMANSALVMAHLRSSEPTKPTKLFMEYCRNAVLSPPQQEVKVA